MITVNVTATDYTVASSSVEYPVTVTADNSIFTVTNQVSTFTVTNVTPVITFSTEGAGFDFAIKHRGEWIPNGDYTRNDVVRYENSIYICQIQFGLQLDSPLTPLEDTASWELFYWNQWTKQYLTITNWLDVGTDISAGGNLDVTGNGVFGGNGEFGGNLTVTGDGNVGGDLDIGGDFDVNGSLIATTGTFTDLTVNNQFTINGLRYPINKGTYGQVLFTGGDETGLAAWVNLGELQAWSLNEDLYTNGFNIVTGINQNGTRPRLRIGNGVTNNFRANIDFPEAGNQIDISADTVYISDDLDVSGNLTVHGDIRFDDATVTGVLKGIDSGTAVGFEYGIRFPDGTVQTSASTSTGFGSTQIASAIKLGVIRVGQYLQINSSTGVLSVDADALPETYSLPAASTLTRGGIRVGNGLEISDNDVLNVSTSTAFGDISLYKDMLTNGYKIKYGTGGSSSYLLLEDNNLSLVGTPGTSLDMEVDLATINSGEAIVLDSIYTQIGPTVYTSELRVQNIYNHAGTSAPFFPAGVQFQDNTIQRTAWRGYDQGLILL